MLTRLSLPSRASLMSLNIAPTTSATALVAGRRLQSLALHPTRSLANYTPHSSATPNSAFLSGANTRGQQTDAKSAPGVNRVPVPQAQVHECSEQSSDELSAVTPGDKDHFINNGPSQPFKLSALMEHNMKFVQTKAYKPYLTDRFPFKKLVIVACMDTRLTELLPRAMDIRNGDAKIIKVAGAMVAHPFGSVMRSILVAVYGLGAEHILVVGHHDCGMTGLDPSKVLGLARSRGVPESTFNTLQAAGLNLDQWLSGFENVQSSVKHSVETIRNHPLLPQAPNSSKKVSVTGLVICPTTGRLDLVTEPDKETAQLLKRAGQQQK